MNLRDPDSPVQTVSIERIRYSNFLSHDGWKYNGLQLILLKALKGWSFAFGLLQTDINVNGCTCVKSKWNGRLVYNNIVFRRTRKQGLLNRTICFMELTVGVTEDAIWYIGTRLRSNEKYRVETWNQPLFPQCASFLERDARLLGKVKWPKSITKGIEKSTEGWNPEREKRSYS